ncbi:hypothetical protein HAX54_025778 [Datura stramonium]|uniref:Uncharacterized protein n=1 Tax=Datura stramonium TaxID=4076 RepID=A0ABS8S7L6_DATST|nr:hypothetical protein [Datura stramonium]
MGKITKSDKGKEMPRCSGSDNSDYDPMKEAVDTTTRKKQKVPKPVQYHEKKTTKEKTQPSRCLVDESEEENVEAQLVPRATVTESSKVVLIEGQSSQPQNTGTAIDKRKRMETGEELQEACERKRLMALAQSKNKKVKAQQASRYAPNRDVDIATRFTSVGGHICVVKPTTKSGKMECFHACVAGCGYKFEVPSHKVDQIHPSRPPQPPPKEKLVTPAVKRILPLESSQTIDDVPGTSA